MKTCGARGTTSAGNLAEEKRRVPVESSLPWKKEEKNIRYNRLEYNGRFISY